MFQDLFEEHNVQVKSAPFGLKSIPLSFFSSTNNNNQTISDHTEIQQRST